MTFISTWIKEYQKSNLLTDIMAGLVVGVLVIPQSLGYAVLAGLPPVYGLYAAIVPVLVYAWAEASNVQAVGPVAITAIMTASGLADYVDRGMEVYASMASLLAVMVGLILWIAGHLKLGWIMQFISRGVSSGFVSGAAVLIFISQIKYITDISISGKTIFQSILQIFQNSQGLHLPTFVLGMVCFILLALNKYGSLWVWQSWLSAHLAKWVERLFPLLLLFVCIALSRFFHWESAGVTTVKYIPSGLPKFSTPYLPSVTELVNLLPTAGLMALIVFVSSGAVTSHYARLRDEPFNANNELKGLGLANLFGGFFQSFTIAGGFSRTAINVDSGAQTPLASVMTTLVMVSALLFLGVFFAPLPYAVLGATIMASIIGLIDVKTFLHAWKVDRLDAISLFVTFLAVLSFGLNAGLVIGLLVSFASMVWQSSNPHIAIVGVLEGTEHFRNIDRHDVQTFDNLLIMRVDESLFFGNSETVHNQIDLAMRQYPKATDIILMMSAVNHIDLTSQEMLIALNNELVLEGKRLNYSVIKGPVMDVIGKTPVITELSGDVFLSTIEAVEKLKN